MPGVPDSSLDVGHLNDPIKYLALSHAGIPVIFYSVPFTRTCDETANHVMGDILVTTGVIESRGRCLSVTPGLMTLYSIYIQINVDCGFG